MLRLDNRRRRQYQSSYQALPLSHGASLIENTDVYLYSPDPSFLRPEPPAFTSSIVRHKMHSLEPNQSASTSA